MNTSKSTREVVGELQLLNGYRRLSLERRWALLEMTNRLLKAEFEDYLARKKMHRKKGVASQRSLVIA